MQTRYGRGDFLGDAEWLGLDARTAFSESALRSRRDALINIHHPDREGGSAEMASRINDTYARMSKWLRRRRERSVARRNAKNLAEIERGKTLVVSTGRRLLMAASMMTTAVGAVAAFALVRARRR